MIRSSDPRANPEPDEFNLDENICEHGDHPAPMFQRFCSPECEACEDTPFDLIEKACAGLCGKKEAESSPAREEFVRCEVIDGKWRWCDSDFAKIVIVVDVKDPHSDERDLCPLIDLDEEVEFTLELFYCPTCGEKIDRSTLTEST